MSMTVLFDRAKSIVLVHILALAAVSYFFAGCVPPYAIPAAGLKSVSTTNFYTYFKENSSLADQIAPLPQGGFVVLFVWYDSVHVVRFAENLNPVWNVALPSDDAIESFRLFLIDGHVMIVNDQETDSDTLQTLARTFDPETGAFIDRKVVATFGEDVEERTWFRASPDLRRLMIMRSGERTRLDDSAGSEMYEYTEYVTVIDGDLGEVQSRRVPYRHFRELALLEIPNNDGSFDFVTLHDPGPGQLLVAVHYPADGADPVRIEQEVSPLLHDGDSVYAMTLTTTEQADGSRLGAIAHSVLGVDILRWNWAAGRVEPISHVVYPDSLISQHYGFYTWKRYYLDYLMVMPDSSLLLTSELYDATTQWTYYGSSGSGAAFHPSGLFSDGPKYILKLDKNGRYVWKSMVPFMVSYDKGWKMYLAGFYAYHLGADALDVVVRDRIGKGVILHRIALADGTRTSRQLVDMDDASYLVRSNTVWTPSGMIFMFFKLDDDDHPWKIIGIRL